MHDHFGLASFSALVRAAARTQHAAGTGGKTDSSGIVADSARHGLDARHAVA